MIAYNTSKHAKVLFVGINPHPGSYRRGVPFSNNKMFWYLLNRSGLLEEAESDLKDDRLLKRIYDKKFLPKYGLNFLNLVDRPTVDVTRLKRGEERAGVLRALKIIRTCKPKVVCFIGKIAFNKFYGGHKCDWGWQAGINDSKVYLMHFPIRGPAQVRVKELREVKAASEDQRFGDVRVGAASAGLAEKRPVGSRGSEPSGRSTASL
jgi:TDG/mug DNA glycosylase family protein